MVTPYCSASMAAKGSSAARNAQARGRLWAWQSSRYPEATSSSSGSSPMVSASVTGLGGGGASMGS